MIKMIKKPLTLVLYLVHHIVLDGRLLCINYRVIQFCLITSLAFELSEPNSDFSSYESESFSDLSIYPLPHISSNLIKTIGDPSFHSLNNSCDPLINRLFDYIVR
jgi:hypothetical protein